MKSVIAAQECERRQALSDYQQLNIKVQEIRSRIKWHRSTFPADRDPEQLLEELWQLVK